MTDPKIVRSQEHDVPEVSADNMWAALCIDRTPYPHPSWWEIFEGLWNTQGGVFPKIRAATHYVSTPIFHMNVAHFVDEPYRDEHGNPCTVTECFAPRLSRCIADADAAHAKSQAEAAVARAKVNINDRILREKLSEA